MANTIDAGTDGDSFMTAEEKAYREAMKTVSSKEAKDWTLDEQKAVAVDIAKNGTSSVVYAKAKAAMEARTNWSVKLTNGKTMYYCIIGINHDDLADGNGKAGLTFLTTSGAISSRINATNTNEGGWEASELRAKMNSGEIWSLIPAEFQSKVKAVKKLTNNDSGAKDGAVVTVTTDKLFLLSRSEIETAANNDWSAYHWIESEGTQYEVFKNHNRRALTYWAWTRSARPKLSQNFIYDYYDTYDSSGDAAKANPVCPSFCF